MQLCPQHHEGQTEKVHWGLLATSLAPDSGRDPVKKIRRELIEQDT